MLIFILVFLEHSRTNGSKPGKNERTGRASEDNPSVTGKSFKIS